MLLAGSSSNQGTTPICKLVDKTRVPTRPENYLPATKTVNETLAYYCQR